jgi:glycosyltransferase involved in cell wall biosynthesis
VFLPAQCSGARGPLRYPLPADPPEFLLPASASLPAPPPSISIVHEWLTDWGGSEDCLQHMLACFPQAKLHATIDYLSDTDRARLQHRPIATTFLQRAPFVRQKFWNYLPITSWAVETHDVGDADVVVSSSHAFAKGVPTHARQMHLSYVYSPMRYAWDLNREYLRDYRLDRGARGVLARYMFHRLRAWDRLTANNVDLFVGISHYVRQRIWRTYRRPALVIYPPVHVGKFPFEAKKEDFYVTVSRLVSYKRVDLMLRAFAQMPQRRLVVIGSGPELPKLQAMCPPNVSLLGWQPHEAVQRHLQSARAFVFAANEDFGISPVEAQACGTPVIAFGAGGSLETVRDLRSLPRPTGLLFDAQTPQALVAAVDRFEQEGARIAPEDCRQWAETFDEAHFRAGFAACLEQAWAAWQADPTSVESRLLASGIGRGEAAWPAA